MTLVRGDNPCVESFELWLSPGDSGKVHEALVKAGAKPVGTSALELLRIAAGIPRYGVDIRERDLPQETEQERALNFSKGCYVGQEIVERIRSRGQVRRKFIGFEYQRIVARAGQQDSGGRQGRRRNHERRFPALATRRTPGGAGLHPPRSRDSRQAS